MKNFLRLSVMMFLQFMMLPVWFVPMFPYVQSLPGGADWALWCGFIMGIGTCTSPLFGMFADRFLNAERVLALCNLAGATFLAAAFFVTSPALLFVCLLMTMCFYMPTWSLVAAIALANAEKEAFARIRVFGTVGWVASGVFSYVGAVGFGIGNFDSTPWIFAAGAFVSVCGGLLAFALPPTPPAQKGEPLSVVDALGLRALVLFKDPQFRNFAILLFAAMIPFQWYNVYCAAYLKESGFRYLTLTINLGQVGEVVFMLLVPLVIRRFGYRGALVIGLLALAFRNVSFACSSAFGLAALDFGAILVHGLIFGLFIVGSQMFVNDHAPVALRNQAQGLMNLLTAGLGVFASNTLFNFVLGSSGARWTVAYLVALAMALTSAFAVPFLLRKTPRLPENERVGAVDRPAT